MRYLQQINQLLLCIEVISFDKDDPQLDGTDPLIIGYNGKNYLTTLSCLRLVCSDDDIHFQEDPAYPPNYGQSELEALSALNS